MPDTAWAYERMRELLAEKQRLEATPAISSQPPKLDAETAMAYRKQTDKALAAGTNSERKQLLRTWVDKITIAPETLEVQINYKVPEPLVNTVGAGALSVVIHQTLAALLIRSVMLRKNGRRSI